MHNTDLCARVRDTCQNHGPGGNSVNKICSAINRVDDPRKPRGAGFGRAFFAHDGIVCKGAAQSFADNQLDFTIGLADKILMTFLINPQFVLVLKEFQRDFPGVLNKGNGSGVAI